MRKVLIIGCGGAGKSTLARELGLRLKIPVTHLDKEFWRAGWQMPKREEWIQRIEDLIRGNNWILDGNFDSSLQIRLAAADTLIYLDFPRYLCFWRLLKRRAKYLNTNRPDMTEGCKEQLDFSFLKWVWNFKREADPKIREILVSHGVGKNIFILKNPEEVKNFLHVIGENK